MNRVNWVEAACHKAGVDTDLFFPERRSAADQLRARQQVIEAKKICGACPIIEGCRQYALERTRNGEVPLVGVWGGWTLGERMSGRESEAFRPKTTVRKDRPRAPYSPDLCGSHQGYQRHIKYRVPICDSCREAEAVYARAQRQKAKARRDAESDARLGVAS